MQVILKRYEVTISDVLAENEQMALHRIKTPDDIMSYNVEEIEVQAKWWGWLTERGWKISTMLLLIYLFWIQS